VPGTSSGAIGDLVFNIPVLLTWLVCGPIFLVACPIAVVVKLSQVSFVGEPPDRWTSDDWLQFAGFMNNLMAIDTSELAVRRQFRTLMFWGADSFVDRMESKASLTYQQLVTAKLIDKLGVLQTVIARTTNDADQLQSQLIKDTNSDHSKLQAVKQADTTKSITIAWCAVGRDDVADISGEYVLASPDLWATTELTPDLTKEPTTVPTTGAKGFPYYERDDGVKLYRNELCEKRGAEWVICDKFMTDAQARTLGKQGHLCRAFVVCAAGNVPVGVNYWRVACEPWSSQPVRTTINKND
jgi:hypothetical protein